MASAAALSVIFPFSTPLRRIDSMAAFAPSSAAGSASNSTVSYPATAER